MDSKIEYFGSHLLGRKKKYYGPNGYVAYIPLYGDEKPLPERLTESEMQELLKRPGVEVYPLGGLFV